MSGNRDPIYAPDGQTWYQTALDEAAKRGEFAARIEQLEAALRVIIENNDHGSYESTGQAINDARAALAQSSPPKAIEREGYPKDGFINDYD